MKMQLDNSVKNIRVGLSWTSGREYSFDLDLSAFLLDEKELARGDEDFVFYNNPVSVGEALRLSGDDRSGIVNGTNESIYVELEKIPENIRKVVFCVTFDETEEEHIFGEAESIVLYAAGVTDEFDKGDSQFCSIDLAKHCAQSCAMAVLALSRSETGWEYDIICDSADFGLLELCSRYGLAAEV
ncbi:MAG: TerD family protein [Clostridia bacterium]|nr:TerD family protein [Clostridia bacterium]